MCRLESRRRASEWVSSLEAHALSHAKDGWTCEAMGGHRVDRTQDSMEITHTRHGCWLHRNDALQVMLQCLERGTPSN